MGNSTLDEEDQYFYQAIVTYMAPTTQCVGIEARSKEDALVLVHQLYGHQLNFDIQSIEPASDDIKRNWKNGKTN